MSVNPNAPGQPSDPNTVTIQNALPRSQGSTPGVTAEPIADALPDALPSYVNPGNGLDDTTTLVRRAVAAGVEAGTASASSKTPSPLILAALAVGIYLVFKRKVAL